MKIYVNFIMRGLIMMYKKIVVLLVGFLVLQTEYSFTAAAASSASVKAVCNEKDYSIKAHNRRVAERKAADIQLKKIGKDRYRSIDRSRKPDSEFFNRLRYFEEKKGYASITPEAEIIDRVKNYEGIENLKFINALFIMHKVNPDTRDACGVPLLVGQSSMLTYMLLSLGADPAIDNDLALKKARNRSVAELLIEAKAKKRE